MKTAQTTTLGDQGSRDASDGTQADRRAQAAESLPNAMLSGTSRYDPNEISRARAVIRLNLVCVVAWIAINARVELLLTDVVMPGMSGLQLTEQAASLRPHLRLLFMSGFPRDLWERGEIDHDLVILEKPLTPDSCCRGSPKPLAGTRSEREAIRPLPGPGGVTRPGWPQQ